MKTFSITNSLVYVLLQFMAVNFNLRPTLRALLKSDHGWIDFSISFRTDNGSVAQTITFKKGRALVKGRIDKNADATMVFRNEALVREIVSASPGKLLYLVMMNHVRTEGNGVCLLLFNYLVTELKNDDGGSPHSDKESLKKTDDNAPARNPIDERIERLKGEKIDPGVLYLGDPFLSEYEISDFPRLVDFLDIHFTEKPEICPERPKLLTDWFVKNGFKNRPDGTRHVPELRQGKAFRHFLKNKKPIIRKNDLIAGTTTSKEIGVVLYPDSHGTMIWAELNTVSARELNPYRVSGETKKTLHNYVFPYWMNRNFKHWVRRKYDDPLCQRLDDRFAVYFVWKSVGLSHTIPDFPKVLSRGTNGIIDEIRAALDNEPDDPSLKRDSLKSMISCLEGLNDYAAHLSRQASADAEREEDAERKRELLRLSEICAKVPSKPAETLDEALNCVWLTWVALHNENTNTGLSLGRLDLWLQPYFEADAQKIESAEDRRAYIKKAIELVGCFFMRCTDHLPLIPDIGNYLFGGSSSDQAITLGGITPGGDDAVCDMTYIFLKVTELLGIRDPNVNARFHPGVNSEQYLKRLCEVNYITAATPSMHNDLSVMKSLDGQGYDVEDVRNWSATGCVEPTLSAKHIGHTGSVMFSLVAALEMAMHNGRHPLMDWKVGPETGRIESGDFDTFDSFYDAYKSQLIFLIDNAVTYNNYLGEAHAVMRPTPFLSAVIDGCIDSGRDVTRGGARYNGSGVACIGLADVVDSLMAVKKHVFEDKKISFADLKRAVDADFEDNAVTRALIMKDTPRFGSGDEESLAMANSVAGFAHEEFSARTNFRGGKYTTGFWSLANHVAFGTLAGALPSGRRAGKSFTPGLTPEAGASTSLLDNIRDVARLDPKNLNNNIAFNVKIVPASDESHEKKINTIFQYVKTYFDLGGMQMQLNVVTSDTLRDAMTHPESYRNLMVRISGYNAYFTTLNKDMQIELIERAEYSL